MRIEFGDFSNLTQEQAKQVEKITLRLKFLYDELTAALRKYLAEKKYLFNPAALERTSEALRQLSETNKSVMTNPNSLPSEEHMAQLQKGFEDAIALMGRSVDVQ